ncbi:polymorphic toxin-type HINT domain-containing protein [Acetivibrio clariflavus]|nr:polymorphic toxin-type HINT domain-containing protein [Acetivibrio clariflavus]
MSKYVFDVSTKRLIRLEDRVGNALRIIYDSKGQIDYVIDDVGRKLDFTFNANGKVESIEDPLTNRSVKYNYSNGLLTKVIDSELKETTYEYDSNDRIVKVIDANNNTAVKIDYDVFGRIVRQYDAEGNVTYQVYSDATNERYIIDARGNESRVRFNLDMRVVEEVDALGNKVVYEYSYYDPGSNKWEVIPDVDIRTLEDNKDPNTKAYTKYLEAGKDKRLKIKETMYDKRGNATTNEYDENNNLVGTVDPLKQTTSMVYDPVYKHNLISKTDKKGNTTTYVYDNEGKYGPKGALLVKEIDPLGNELIYDYYTNESGIKIKGLVKTVTEKKRVDQKDPNSELIEFKVTEYKYDDLYNNRTQIIDTLGNSTYEEYDAAGRLQKVTNARGYTTKYTYDKNDRIIVEEIFPQTNERKILKRTESIYDNVGNKTFVIEERFAADRPDYPKEDLVTETVYDRNNRPVQIYDAEGYRVSYTYDEAGNKVTETDKRGFTTIYKYDELNRVTEVIDPLNNTTTYEYDANGNVIKITDAKNRVTFIDYDELDRKWKERIQYNEDGEEKEAVYEYLYDENDNPYREIDPNGKIIEYEYDALNRITKEVDGLGLKDKNGNSMEKIVTYSYNYESVVEDGKTVKYEVMTEKDYLTSTKIRPIVIKNDALGRMRIKIETNNGDKTIQEYDEVGNLKSVKDARGNVTSYEYDGLNNIIKVIDATRINYSEAVFDSVGNVIEKIDRRNNKTEYRYNKLNQVIKTTTWYTDENGVKQEVVSAILYDEAGNKKIATDAEMNSTIFEYDELGRLVAETNPMYNTRYYGYDAVGNQVWVTDWKEHDSSESNVHPIINSKGETVYRLKTTYEYDDFDRLKTVISTEGEITSYTYDVIGNIKTVTVDGVRKNTYSYDKMYRLEKMLDGEDRAETYDEYDLFGRLLQKTDRNGQVHIYTYDEYDNVEIHTVTRKVKENGVEKVVKDVRETYYDALGNVVRTVDETGETIYNYNELNLLDNKVLPDGKTVEYEYDEEGNIKEIKDPSGNVTTYLFDEMNRMKTVTTKDGTTTYAYTKNGNRKSLKLPNNVLTTYEYDARNVLIKLVNQVGSSVDIYEYEYDENSLQTAKIEPKGKTSFEYDNLGRIKTVVEPGGRTTTYAYDGAGNRKEQTVEDALNDVSSKLTYHYDRSNRLTDVLEVRNGSNITTVYTYDGNGNQIKVAATEPGDVINVSEYTFDGFNQLKVAKTQDSTSTSKYDAFGLRVEKTVDGVTTKYYYDGQSILLEVRSDGLESHNIQGVNLIARKIKGDSDTLYYLYNGHADVVKLVDGAANTVNEYDYDIFGNILYQLESKPNPYKYSGYYYDDDTGYYYLRSRYYDPKIARFISEDTYTGEYNDPLSLNLYTYCQNDPITYDDPNGHWLHIAAGALIGGLVNTAITAVSDFMEDGKFNKSWREYAGSFAEGAITGAIGAATGGASFIAAAAASAAGSVVGNAVGQYISKGKVDVKEALFAGATDLVTMGAGKLAGNLTKKGMNKFAKTAVGENVLKKANSVKSKVLNKISGVKTKVQSIVKRECKHPELGMCFTADTLVYTKDGHKRIEDIKVGDQVYSVNVDTGEKGLKTVKQLFVNETYELIHIYVGYSQIKSTAPHPFWVEGKGWVEAGNLLEGDKVKLYSGEVLEIKEIRRERLEEPVKTYNFEVEDWHTYLVSENNVLVHNAGSKKCPLKFSFKSNKSNAGNNNVKSKLRDSRTINFSQKSIDSKFSDGTNIKDTIYRLKNDPSYAEKMEPIRIVKYKDLPADVQQKLASQNVGKHTVFTLDNRRLYAARKAKVKVNTRWATPEEIQNFATVKRFTTINGGKMPEVRW